MSCSEFPTIQTAKTFKLDAETQNEVVTSENDRTSPASDGKTKLTLKGFENQVDTLIAEGSQEITDAIESTIGKSYIGTWTQGVTTFTTMNEYSDFNGITYKPKSGVTLPYTAQTADPTTAPDNANVEPFSDVNSANLGGLSNYQAASVADMIAGMALGGHAIDHAVGQVWGIYGNWRVVSISSPMTQSNFEPIGHIIVRDFGAAGDGVADDTSPIVDAVQAAASYHRAGASLKSVTGIDGDIYLISGVIDITGASLDMYGSVIKLADNFQFGTAITFDGTGVVGGCTIAATIDGNRSNQSFNVKAMSIESLTSPLSDIRIRGNDCNTLLRVSGNTEKIDFNLKATTTEIVVNEENGTGEGDVTPDENRFNIFCDSCGTAYRRHNADSTSYVFIHSENAIGNNSYLIDVSGGSKVVKVGGMIRTPQNTMLFDALSVTLFLDNLVVFAPSTDGLRINNCQCINGTVHFNATAEPSSSAYGLVIGKSRYGGILNYTNIEKSPLATYGVRIGSGTSVSCDNLIFNASGLNLHLDIQFAKRCTFNLQDATLVNIGESSESNTIRLSSNFISDNNQLNNQQPVAGANKVFIDGSITNAVLNAYSYPTAGMEATLVRGSAGYTGAIYDGAAWKYPTYS
ncbi:pectin lyase fold protein [Vibrio phage 1.233.A._10N.261.51.E6]|nr:pectin lyase fold protein [Vibrio phage 1.233.A._10N.261.51.E6]AUR96895.1 pectin lyase fold protein [Vibrio phage 1.233.B._10N.261.51.E6]